MSYIDQSLTDGETVLYRARFPWFFGVSAFGALAACIVAAVIASLSSYNLLAATLVSLGIVVFCIIMWPIWTTEIGVTNQRFIYNRGLLSRETHELQLRAVEEVNVAQGLLGRLFDFGRLELHGTGVDDIRLPKLSDPIGLRKALQDGMAAATQPLPNIVELPVRQSRPAA
jgi:uncharacterized membrane protein YdbT with pleckstrin-like domain